MEIGCGMAPLFSYIDWDFNDYTIFEPGERFMNNAKTLALKEGKKVNLIQKPFSVNECVGMHFDAVVCSSLLHEVQNPLELLEDIGKIADSETIIHINVPNANSFHRLLAKEIGYIDDVKQLSDRNNMLQQSNVFDMDDLIAICDKSGLKTVDSGSYFVKPFTHDQMKKMMDTGIIREEVLNGLYGMTKYMPELGSEIYVNCKKQDNN